MIDCEELIRALLGELMAVASDEERRAHDSAWLRGYVAGVATAANTIMELGTAPSDGGSAEG